MGMIINDTTYLECQNSLLSSGIESQYYGFLQQLLLPLLLAYLSAKTLGSKHALIHGILNLAITLTHHWSSSASAPFPLTWQVPIYLVLPMLYVGHGERKQRNLYEDQNESDKIPQASYEDNKRIEHGSSFLEPLLFPSQTSHRRLYPTIHSSDYLNRGTSFCRVFLRRMLEMYLVEQGIQPSVYPHVYLVTAPQFLGFGFNPASF